MKKELENKIISAHPLLYRDSREDKTTSCMYWGLAVGEGWYDIIWELSQKLEKIIEQYVEDNPDLECYTCGCDESTHTNGKCSTIHHLPYILRTPYAYPVPQWKRDLLPSLKNFGSFRHFWKYTVWKWVRGKTKTKVYRPINRFFNWLYEKYNIGYDKPCGCNGFKRNYPAAAQVKEKFGTLCFYMTGYTDEISAAIKDAVAKSNITCDECGVPGTLRQVGWWRVVCDDCEEKRYEK